MDTNILFTLKVHARTVRRLKAIFDTFEMKDIPRYFFPRDARYPQRAAH